MKELLNKRRVLTAVLPLRAMPSMSPCQTFALYSTCSNEASAVVSDAITQHMLRAAVDPPACNMLHRHWTAVLGS